MSDFQREEYDSIDALNWSTLKVIDDSPALVKHMHDHPDEQCDKPAFKRGRAIHCATLEPEVFAERYIVEPDFDQLARDKFGSLRTNAAKQFRDEQAESWRETAPKDAERITQEEYNTALRCAHAIQEHPVAREYMADAKTEQTITWNRHGTKCKGRVDAVNSRIIDIKSTRHFNIRHVMRDFWNYKYHGQLAWYHTGAFLNGLVKPNAYPAAIVVAQAPNTSFVDVAVVDMERYKDTFDAGVAYCDKLLELYIGCKATGYWPGMAPNIVPWELPDWIKG